MFALPATTRPCRPLASGQRGASLLMVLILMLVISMLAVFGVRNVRLLERQTTNEQEYQLARQAAEAALRDAEADLNGPGTASCPRSNSNPREGRAASAESDEFSNDCKLGQCGAAVARYAVTWENASKTNPGAPWWPDSKGGNWGNNADNDGKPSFNCSTATGGVPLGTFTGVAQLARVVRQPEYLIELITPEQAKQASAATPPASAASAAVSTLLKCPGKTTVDGSDVLAAANEKDDGKPLPRPSCNLFRITARGFGLTTDDLDPPLPRVEVVLQSYVYTLIK